MNILWLGHGTFRIEIGDQILLVDPFLTDNPMIDETQIAAAIDGVTQILITHGHFDHTADVHRVVEKTGASLVGIYELMSYYEAEKGYTVQGFNFGGTVQLGNITASLVPALHSTSLNEAPQVHVGREAGFVIKGEDRVIYLSGDTGISAEMDWIGDYHKPDIGILSAGGHFTMGMAEAAYAAKRYFNFKTVIPCHYRTMPLLEQSAQVLVDALPGVDVIEPQVMEPIQL